MKKIIIKGDKIETFGIEDLGEEIEIMKDGVTQKVKVDKKELFEGENISKEFTYRQNSFEFGKAGQRHKIYYFNINDGERKLQEAKQLEILKEKVFTDGENKSI